MDSCPTCQRLAREVEILRRIDYRACAEKARELVEHQTTTHIFHIAHAEESKFEQSSPHSDYSHNRVE